MADYTFDLPRRDRIGLDESVFCGGMTPGQIAAILDGVGPVLPGLLLTRLEPEKFAALPADKQGALDYDAVSRTAILGHARPMHDGPPVAIVLGGTSDVPVGREAERVLQFNGQRSRIFADIGVAGLWRLMERIDEIRRAPVVIVAAGLDAALVTAVGGLVPGVVIAVPTSIGYGVAAGGMPALQASLASSAPGVAVVNIDNGYGAACAALRVLQAARSIA